MGDTPILSNSGSTLLPPMQVMRRCQQTPHCLIILTIGMLIAGGMCMILLPSKSLQSVDKISSNPINDLKIMVNANSSFTKPLKRTRRLDTLGETNLTYLINMARLTIDALNRSMSDFCIL